MIFATGSRPKKFSLGNDEKVYLAEDVLLGRNDPGKSTVIIGSGLVGCELALHLREKGIDVTLLEGLDRILVNGPLCHANKDMLEALIPYNSINTIVSAKAKSYDGKNLIYEKDGIEHTVCADSVILSVGYSEENSLYRKMKDKIAECYLVGDARKVSNIMYAIWDAFEVANSI